MLLIVLKRLWNRPLLTLLSIAGVVLAVGLVTSIPIFAQSVSFRILQQEMLQESAKTGRPPFSLRVHAVPTIKYPISLQRTQELAGQIEEALVTEIGLPLVALYRQVEATGVMLGTTAGSPYPGPDTFLASTSLAVLPGVGPHLTIVEGESMETARSPGDALNVWMYYTVADEMGIQPGERYVVTDLRHTVSIPVRIAGTWRAANPRDGFWFQDPDLGLRTALLAREEECLETAGPQFDALLGFASWYLIMDDSRLSVDRMQDYADGIALGVEIISRYLPDVRVDGSPLDALNASIQREKELTALLFVFSVPLIGFLLYFLFLISAITIRWQQRETAVMVSRGMRSGQLLLAGAIESLLVTGIGCPLGILTGIELARVMGYTRSFISFVWRAALPISPTSFSVPVVAVVALTTLLARLGPIVRAARTSVVEHERTRARTARRPLWQRFYLDFALLAIVLYAHDQLAKQGTLVPRVTGRALQSVSWWVRFTNRIYPEMFREQDPLVFLVPAMFTVALSLLLVRFFPTLMRVGDWLSSFGRRATFYLAFRQLSRQSGQYTSALLLVVTSLSLGSFMASMAESLDKWLVDRVYYKIGSDVLLNQKVRDIPGALPGDPRPGPTEGMWVLPASSYTEIPGVIHAARAGLYPAVIVSGARDNLTGTFIGIDRLDLPEVLFFRADFGEISLGEMMNRLGRQSDGVIVSEQLLSYGYEIGDPIQLRIYVADVGTLETDLTIVGTYKYFPTVYEDRDRETAVVGNLNFLFDQIGATLIHDVWLKVDPRSDSQVMIKAITDMEVGVNAWLDTRDEIVKEQAKPERVGVFGTLTIGFLGAATLAGIGLLVYNYASLQERLFRFAILRAVGLSLMQIVGQVGIEYLVLMVYGVIGGAAIGVLASVWFIPYFQAPDTTLIAQPVVRPGMPYSRATEYTLVNVGGNILNPPALVPLVAWDQIDKILAVFSVALVIAQIAVISAALRRQVFQALRMGDRE